MARPRAKLVIRSFREGDERLIAELFNAYMRPFVGPCRVTPRQWREQYRRRSWCAPSLTDDPSCARLALRGRSLVGYVVTDYESEWGTDVAVVQELCVAAGPDAGNTAGFLLADAEEQARARGRGALLLALSHEDGVVRRAAETRGFEMPEDGSGVFMTAVVDLPRLLRELASELNRRLQESAWGDWEGVIRLESGEQAAVLRVHGRTATVVSRRGRPDLVVTVEPDALPQLLLGRLAVGEAFLQRWLTVRSATPTADPWQPLRVLDALFPRLPIYLPRAQWW